MDLPSTKDAIGGMIFGGLLQSKMDKFEKAFKERGGQLLDVVMYNPEASSYRGELTRAFAGKF